jgi:hypothetical protein
MLLLEGAHFDEDSRAVYDVIASSTLGTMSYADVKKFEKSRNGWLALLALKFQFGGEAFDLTRSNTANEVLRSATFTGPTRKYTYDQHIAKFEDAFNELALLGEPVLEPSKVRLFCKSLKEKFMKASAIDTQKNKETASSFSLAMAHIKSVRELHVADGADKEDHNVEAYPKPGVKYRSIAAELKATLLLEGDHFDEDSAAVYDVIASLTVGTSGYSYIKKFEETRNGRLALLTLKLQCRGEAYDLSRSNAANEVIRSSQGLCASTPTTNTSPSSRTPTTSAPFSVSQFPNRARSISFACR